VALFLVSAWIVLLDQISKTIVMRALYPYEAVHCLGGMVRITHVRNPGAAFGILQNQVWLFATATFLVASLVLTFYRRVPRSDWCMKLGLALGLGGSLGNLVDRLRFGSVIDFIEIEPFPVFNLADCAIVAGVILLLFAILRTPSREEE
jgi:signal peptidase II